MTIRTSAGVWSSYMLNHPLQTSRDDRHFAWTLSFFCRVHVSLGLSRSSGSSSTLLSRCLVRFCLLGLCVLGRLCPGSHMTRLPLVPSRRPWRGLHFSAAYTRLSTLVTTVFA